MVANDCYTWSSVLFVIAFIINLVIIYSGDNDTLRNALKFDPLDKETWKKETYEKSFSKLTKKRS